MLNKYKMRNLFYDLPEEIIIKIYYYDKTYQDIYKQMINSFPLYIGEAKDGYKKYLYNIKGEYIWFFGVSQIKVFFQIIKVFYNKN